MSVTANAPASLLLVTGLVTTLAILHAGRATAAQADERDSTVVDTVRRYVPAAEFTHAGLMRATLYGRLPLSESDIDPVRAALVGGLFGGVLAKLHIDMASAWWPDSGTSRFRLKDDWTSVLQIDKAGHAFAGYTMAYAMSEALMATGVSWRASTVWGSQLALLYQTYVEIEDGFAEGWGFSLTDMVANTIGAELHMAQHFIPSLQSVAPKYQYVPASWIDVPRVSTTWIDDYNSSTFWLSLSLRELLPAGASRYWPSWLTLAVGYGVSIDDTERRRRLIIALDYDLVALLPDGGVAWNWLRQTLNLIKLPAPAIEIGERVTLYWMFPW